MDFCCPNRRIIQWAFKGFLESQVETEYKRINKAREIRIEQKIELETLLKASREAFIHISKLESFAKHVRSHLPLLDFVGKYLALDMLDITLWLDGEVVEITGTLDFKSDFQIVLPDSRTVDRYACL